MKDRYFPQRWQVGCHSTSEIEWPETSFGLSKLFLAFSVHVGWMTSQQHRLEVLYNAPHYLSFAGYDGWYLPGAVSGALLLEWSTRALSRTWGTSERPGSCTTSSTCSQVKIVETKPEIVYKFDSSYHLSLSGALTSSWEGVLGFVSCIEWNCRSWAL